MRLRNLTLFTVWSNTAYLAPLVLAYYWALYPTLALVVAVISFGCLYHLSNESRYLWPDRISALLLISSNLVLCYLGAFQAPYFWIALLFVGFAFLYHFVLQNNKGQYELNHGMWHIYGALITIFCILALVL